MNQGITQKRQACYQISRFCYELDRNANMKEAHKRISWVSNQRPSVAAQCCINQAVFLNHRLKDSPTNTTSSLDIS